MTSKKLKIRIGSVLRDLDGDCTYIVIGKRPTGYWIVWMRYDWDERSNGIIYNRSSKYFEESCESLGTDEPFGVLVCR